MATSTHRDPAGEDEPWRRTVLEPLLRGLAHALANRATALDGLAADVAEAASPAHELADAMHAEVAQLLAVHRDLRALLPDVAGAEPVDLRDVAREALSLAAYWPAGSFAPASITGDAPIVRVVRGVALRVVLGMLVHAGLDGPPLELVLAGDDRVATLRVAGGDAARARGTEPSPWREQVGAQARAIGGRIAWERGGAELRLPSLRALRAHHHSATHAT